MMNFYKRSIRYVVRQKVRSLLLGSVLFVSLFVCLSGVILMRSTNELINVVAINSNANVAVFDLNFENSIVSDDIDRLMAVENIRGVNRENHLNAVINDYVYVGLVEPIFAPEIRLHGIDYLDQEGPFFLQDKQLTSGSLTLSPNEIVIFEDVADFNEWRVGSVIPIANAYGQVVDVTIAGIYRLGEMSARLDSTVIYVSPDFIDHLQGYEGYSSALFYVINPSLIEETKEELTSLLIGSDFTWGTSDFLYRQMRSQLNQAQELVETMVIATVVISTVIVALLLSLWARERRKETALLLAIGEHKVFIFSQRLLEIFSIFSFIFIVLSALFWVLSPVIIELFYEMTALDLSNELIADFNMGLSLYDIFTTGWLGMLVLFISVWISLIPIMRLKPKTIFGSVD